MLESYYPHQSTVNEDTKVMPVKNPVWTNYLPETKHVPRVIPWLIGCGPLLGMLQRPTKNLIEVLIHVQRKGKTTIMRTTDNLLTFADRLLMRSGISLTNWLSHHIPEEMAGDLCEIRHNLEEDGRSSMMILLCVFAQAVLTLWGCFQIWLQSTISTDEETTGISNLVLAVAN